MNTDFRVSIGLMSHPKTVKLVRKCGDGAFMCLLKMWGWATQFKPEGDLSGMDNDDIEIIAGWSGEPGTFVSRLAEVGFLDGESGEYSLHDWGEHNPWVAGATVRSEAASKAGKASAAKRAKNLTDVQRDVNGRSTDVQRDVNGNSTPSPSPSPSPSPTTKEKDFVTASKAKRFTPPTIEEVAEYCRSRGNNVDPQRWIDHYTSNGWKVGKNPMKDWRAAVRTWEGSGVSPPAKTGGKGIHSGFSEKDYGAGGLI